MMATERSRFFSSPVSAQGFLVFRALYGFVAAFALVRFWLKDWTRTLIAEPEFRFPYWGFEWLPRLSESAAVALCCLGSLSALSLSVGYAPRRSAALLSLCWAWLKLSDQAFYLNHDFFILYVGLALTLAPHPSWKQPWMAPHLLWTLRSLVACVYTFAGIAKWQADWLIRHEPLQTWLSHYGDWPFLGWLTSQPWAPGLFSWGGMLFDSTIILWLAWSKTRPLAFMAVVGFHTLTGLLFPIGMFPLFMVVAATLWLDPRWPQRLYPQWHSAPPRELPSPRSTEKCLLLAFVCVQLALPLRHWLYPGHVLWNEQGFRFSWRVMLIEKTGHVVFHVKEVGGSRRWELEPDERLTPQQRKEMSIRPDMIWSYAQILAREFEVKYGIQVAVYAESVMSLNGRRQQLLTDPNIDLTRAPRDGAGWILPAPSDL